MTAAKFNACAICAHDIGDKRCVHPWGQPFERWPRELLRKLKEMVPDQFDPPPPAKV